MNNCNCIAYPFPHRPGSGQCISKQVHEQLTGMGHKAEQGDVEAIIEAYGHNPELCAAELIAEGLTLKGFV